MIQRLQSEMKELLNRNEDFMLKLIGIISEQEALAFEKEERYKALEKKAETSNFKADKIEKENLILREEKRMLELKLSVSEDALKKSDDRIGFLEREFENIGREIPIEGCVEGQSAEETKVEDIIEIEVDCDDEIFDTKDELFDKIRQSIKQKRYRKVEAIFNKNLELIKNCKEEFDENELLIISYLGIKNGVIRSLMKSVEDLNEFIRADGNKSKAIRFLKDEKDAPYGYMDSMCYDKYILSEKDIFNDVDNTTLRYIKSLGEEIIIETRLGKTY